MSRSDENQLAPFVDAKLKGGMCSRDAFTDLVMEYPELKLDYVINRRKLLVKKGLVAKSQRGSNRQISDRERAELEAMFRSGMSVRQVSFRSTRSVKTLRGIRAYVLNKKKRKPTKPKAPGCAALVLAIKTHHPDAATRFNIPIPPSRYGPQSPDQFMRRMAA